MDNFYPALLVLNLLWTIGLSVLTYARKPGEEAALAAARMEERLGGQVTSLERRVGVVETHMEHMPSSEELAQLEGLVKTLVERTNGIAETLQSLRSGQGRIEQWILNTKG